MNRRSAAHGQMQRVSWRSNRRSRHCFGDDDPRLRHEGRGRHEETKGQKSRAGEKKSGGSMQHNILLQQSGYLRLGLDDEK